MAAINRSTDMTTGSIWKRMVSFAVPVFLGNLCQQMYNTVDSVIVGKFVGKQALAAVASSGNLIFMMTGFFMGLFIGAGIVIAQYFGAKNYEKVRAAVHTDFAFALCCGVLLTLLGVFFTPTILTWMRTPADVLDTSILYFRLYFLGSLATILYNAGMGILQAVGDSRSPLYYLVISSAVNVALDLLFVGAMDMGVAGAAVATVISQVVSAVLCIIKLTRSDGPYRLEIKRIGFDLPLLKKITSQGVPSGVQNSIIAIANVVVQSNINTFGSDAMAGCGSYSKVDRGTVLLLPGLCPRRVRRAAGRGPGPGAHVHHAGLLVHPAGQLYHPGSEGLAGYCHHLLGLSHHLERQLRGVPAVLSESRLGPCPGKEPVGFPE